MEAVERRFLGVASATLVTFRVLGQLIAMALIVLFVNIYLGGGSIAAGRGSSGSYGCVIYILYPASNSGASVNIEG